MHTHTHIHGLYFDFQARSNGVREDIVKIAENVSLSALKKIIELLSMHYI